MVGSLLVLSCCKSHSQKHTSPETVAKPAQVESKLAAGTPPISPTEKIAAVVGLADGLADLKPINDKPFPEGATEEQVCEAIENTQEKDLWVRFGHLVPMHVFGSIFVIDAKSKTPAEVREFIRANHYGWDSRTKFCDETLALVYMRGFADDHDSHGHIEGRATLAQQLSKGLQVKVRESFSFPDNQERLSNYCRADAELCEKLVKLDEANEGKGSCSHALIRCGNRVPENKEASKIEECIRLGSEKVSCINFVKSMSERLKCDATIEKLLCPD